MPPPVELEADTPFTVLPLIPTVEGYTRHLLVRELKEPGQSESDQLRLIEKTDSSTLTREKRDNERYRFNKTDDVAVPLYTIQPEWAIRATCHGEPVVFSFPSRHDVLELQRFITGYEVKDSFFGVEVLLDLKGKRSLKKFGLREKTQHHGVGEVQLWEWPEEPSDTTPLQPEPMTARQSMLQTPPASIAPSEASRADAVTVHPDQRTGRRIIVSTVTPPPLLVMFLREEHHYTMLSINVTDFDMSPIPTLGGWRQVSNPRQVNICTVNRSTGLESWNLCCMAATNIPDADTSKCESLHTRFQDTAETARFEETLEDSHRRHRQKGRDLVDARNARLAEIMQASSVVSGPYESQSPISPRSSSLFQAQSRPSQLSASPHTSSPQAPRPVMSGALRLSQLPEQQQRHGATWSNPLQDPQTLHYNTPAGVYPAEAPAAGRDHHFSWPPSAHSSHATLPGRMTMSALHNPDMIRVSRPLARHHSLPEGSEPEDYVMELETERQPGEVHGNSALPPELPEFGFMRWGGRGHERH